MGGDCLKQLFQNLNENKKLDLLNGTIFTSVLDLISRIPKDVHLNVAHTIKQICEENGLYVFVSKEFEDKMDHGDIDMFYVDKTVNVVNLIVRVFKPIVIKCNGTVTTFSYKFSSTEYFQVDFIHVENEELSKFFFSYGDIGMTMGMMANRHNLKYSDNGLFLKVNGKKMNFITSSDLFAEQEEHIFELSKSPEKICEFFGLNYHVWLNGFNTSYEAYEWLAMSKFYIPSHFVEGEEKLKKHDRPKRKFTKGFDDFSQKMEPRQKIENSDVFDCATSFFEKLSEIQIICEQIKQKRQIDFERATKFNGKMFIMKGHTGKKVGTLINQFKLFVENKFETTFEVWLDSNTKEFVKDELDIFYSFTVI